MDDFNPGVGGFICCDKCSVWQHMSCMGVRPNKVPKTYECEMCSPRPVDKEAAIQLQLMLRAEESSDSESEKVTKKAKRGKRMRKPSACSQKPEEPIHLLEEGCSYKELKENMYSPAIQHRLEPRTEGQASFDSSPPGLLREQPQAGNGYNTATGNTGVVQAVGKGTSKIIITKQIIRSGSYVIDLIGHFKRLSELFEELGGKSVLYKRPINYVLHYPLLDLCIDTREYGNISRYIRRSCAPNSYTKSYLKDGKLRVGVYARDIIPMNAEITLPFDFHPDEYQFTQSCACITVGCQILKNNDKIAKLLQRSDSINADSILSDDDHSRKPKLSREEVKLQSYIQTIEKIEREEQRKRELSDNMKSPVRENNETEDASTPSKMGKRKRKGSGKKLRKGSSSSRENKSPQHFLFAPEVIPPPTKQLYNIPTPPNPPYSVKELKTSKMHLHCNGIGHDVHLRAMNTVPNSKYRKDLSLKHQRNITPIKVQRDGFVVPIVGSLLAARQSQVSVSYKTSKKRWLEQYILETKNKTSDDLSPRQQPQNTEKDNSSVCSGNNEHTIEQENTVEEALTEATKTLKLSDIEKQESSAELQLSTLPSMEVETEVLPAAPLSATIEKKKKVSLADYKKRLQSRGSKTRESVASDISIESKSDKENSPRLKPVFEPISPEDADRYLQSSSLLEEFSKPSLSETLSTESLHPHKIRRLDGSKNSEVFAFSKSLSVLSSPLSINSPQTTDTKVSDTPPYSICNGGHHTIGSSPPTSITDDTFTKIKEILTRNNVPTASNITTTVVKNNRSLYDNSYSLHPENKYTQDPKRLKSSISNNDYKK